MKFTLCWLKEHLETDASLEQISERLSALGLVVEKIENKAEKLKPFKICEIIDAEKHPNADRLKVCKVNTGQEVLQVVCGGANARKGLKTVLARPGDIIPSTQQVLKVGQVRGVESFGMMCSAEELLLGESEHGIIEVDPEAPIGESYAKWIGLNDPLIEISVTPNRGDCLGVYGVARDLSATGIGKLKPLAVEKVAGVFPSSISLEVDAEASPHFTGRMIRGVKNAPSPKWLQQKLLAIGLKPISTLVDITNYFAYDQGRPLHVFDADKIQGNLKVRLSKEGETFKALDGKEYTLKEDMTVIEDDSGIISLAGIMGGESTGCDESTQNVFLESAFFDPIRIAMTGRELGILSDSRYRFERGVDPLSTHAGLEAATQMILTLCGGEASEIVSQGTPPQFNRPIDFNIERIKNLGGTEVSFRRASETLKALGFEVKEKGEALQVLPPSWRFDVDHDADLVEEILRVEGYDTIPSIPFGGRPEQKPLSPLQERRFVVREKLANRGLMEVITWSFMTRGDAEFFGGVADSLVLLNPISQDLSVMRPSLLPNLLKAVNYNQNRDAEAIGLFEVGPQYSSPAPEGQHIMVSGLRAGNFTPGNWAEKKRPVDIYDIKADAYSILEISNLCPQLDRTAPSWYHPGRSATLKLGNQILGCFGEIHPQLLKKFDVEGPIVAFEIFLDRIPLPKRKTTAKAKLNLSPYQVVERDYAFIVDSHIPAENLIKAAIKAERELIESISIFDVFELKDNKKSLGVRIRLQPKDRTLTEEEIQGISNRIIASISQETGGGLRQ